MKKRKQSTWWYFSFSDENRFRGAVIVEGEDFMDAHLNLHLRDLSPGGQVLGVPIPDISDFPSDMRYRILTEYEVCNRLEGKRLGEKGLV